MSELVTCITGSLTDFQYMFTLGKLIARYKHIRLRQIGSGRPENEFEF